MQFVDQATDGPVQDLARDTPNERLIHTKHGFDIKLERRNPYGFVYVVWHKGPAPDKLSGAYSDFDKARHAVETYISNDTFNSIVSQPAVIEKAEYKKKYRNV